MAELRQASGLFVSARIGAMILSAASASGVRAADLIAATGFEPTGAHDADARIPLETEEALWNEAARLSGDSCFGLHAAESWRPGVFDVMEYAARTAPNVRLALQSLARYNQLVHDVAVFKLIDHGGALRVEHHFRGSNVQPCRHAVEFTLASLVVVGQAITGKPILLERVQFRHSPPPCIEVYVRLFGREPRFSSPFNAIDLDMETAARPVLTADPVLAGILERHADAQLATRRRSAESMVERLRDVLARALPTSNYSLGKMASALGMSQRSVQRKLEEEGTTFKALLDEVRREFALRYLEDRKLAIGEIAYLLGYAEASPFYRAFKRWTRSTPEAVRQMAVQSSRLHQ